jgi:HK97 family phage major capsid protein
VNITKALRDWLVHQKWIAADASDADVRKLVGEKLLAGQMSAQQLADLTKDNAPGKKAVVVGPPPAPGSSVSLEDIKKAVAEGVNERLKAMGLDPDSPERPTMPGLLTRSAEIMSRPDVRVKAGIERYDVTRKSAVYPERAGLNGMGSKNFYGGRPATLDGRTLYLPSDRDKALCGVYFKFALTKSNRPEEIPHQLRMTEHDKDILLWSMKNCDWVGSIHADEDGYGNQRSTYVERRRLTDLEQKALLDDTTSGGIEITPIEFDDALITIPVLFGEIFPNVEVVNIARGRRIKGGTVANPTFTSGTAEGSPIQAFNTSAFVGQFDTTIFTAVAAMEVGLDFEEDSPTNIGQIITQKYGEKFLEYLDRVCVVGDGVTEPQGILTSSAPVVVTSDLGTDGPPTVSDYEQMLFGVAKQYRNTKGSRNFYFANEVTYRRARAINVGPGDERRVFGMDHQSYTLLDAPYKIQANVPNNKAGFVNGGYYRFYRRLGLNTRIETAGQYLALRNVRLIVVRARQGGQLTLGGAATICTTFMN